MTLKDTPQKSYIQLMACTQASNDILLAGTILKFLRPKNDIFSICLNINNETILVPTNSVVERI